MTTERPTERLESLNAAKCRARTLSREHGCIYSVLGDGEAYLVQPGGASAATCVASYFCDAAITQVGG